MQTQAAGKRTVFVSVPPNKRHMGLKKSEKSAMLSVPLSRCHLLRRAAAYEAVLTRGYDGRRECDGN